MSWTPLRRSLAGEGAMVGADLTDANLYGATLTEVDLSDANLAGGAPRAGGPTHPPTFYAPARLPCPLTLPPRPPARCAPDQRATFRRRGRIPWPLNLAQRSRLPPL